MSLHHHAHLIRMANQIAANLSCGREDAEVVEAICNHLEKFWARSMKQGLIACLEQGNTELTPIARSAVKLLKKRKNPAVPPN